MKKFPEIPGYRFIKLIGRGGMADVYLAVQQKLDRMVAVKVLLPEIFRSKVSLKRFIREAKTLSRLVHPNIITVYDVGQVGESYYIVMEYLQDSLKERIRSKGKMDPPQALHVIRQVAGALYYAHKVGFIHRDIKPDNIMFRKDGTPVILDFGIARPIESETKLTKTGMSIGTPNYISPEQARGDKVDGRSDIYSLGVVLYELLTGKVPYHSENTLGVVIKHIQEPIPQLTGKLKKYQHLLNKMMHKDKAHRVRSERELNEIIKSLLNYDPLSKEPYQKDKKSSSKGDGSRTQLDLEQYGTSAGRFGTPGSGSTGRPVSRKKAVPKIPSKPKEKERKVAGRRKPRKSFRPILILALLILLAGLVGLLYLYLHQKIGYQTLDAREVQSMVRKHNYFDQVWNKYGHYDHRFEKNSLNQNWVVADEKAGLMWHQSGSGTALSLEQAQQWIRDLNRRGYAGFHDWRLPTLREAAMLLKKKEGDDELFIHPVFSSRQSSIWTGDNYGKQEAWVVSFEEGYILHHEFHSPNYIRPLRPLR